MTWFDLLGRAGGLALLLLLPGLASAAVFDAHAVRADVLPNGLRVLVAEEPEASAVAVEIVVKAGVADERPTQSGAAHLLEHVLWAYGGTEDPRLAIEDLGGVTNAGTLRDFTHYYATVPAGPEAAAETIRALANLVLRDRFSETVVAREKRVIQEEIAGRDEEGKLRLSDLAFATVYGPNHPYGRPLEGEHKIFAQLDATMLGAVHRAWYVPNNMAVVVVGRVTLPEVMTAVRAAFGDRPRAPAPTQALPAPARPGLGREVKGSVPGTKAYLMAAYVGPAISEPVPVCATDALTVLLSNVTYGRLCQRLLGPTPLAESMGVDFLTQKGCALLGVWVVCEPARVKVVQRAIREEMSRLASEALSSQELTAAVRLNAAAYAFSNETPAQRATTLAFYEALGRYREAGQYPARVRGLRAADLSQVAAWYAGEPTWILLSPKEKKP